MRIESIPPPSDYSQGPSDQSVVSAALVLGAGYINASQSGLPQDPVIENAYYRKLNQAALSNPGFGTALKQYSDLMHEMQNGTADLGAIKTLFECVSSFVDPSSLTPAESVLMGKAWIVDAGSNAFNMQYGASPIALKNSLDQCCIFLNRGGEEESISLLEPAYTTIEMILKGQLDPTNNSVIGEIVMNINNAYNALPTY